MKRRRVGVKVHKLSSFSGKKTLTFDGTTLLERMRVHVLEDQPATWMTNIMNDTMLWAHVVLAMWYGYFLSVAVWRFCYICSPGVCSIKQKQTIQIKNRSFELDSEKNVNVRTDSSDIGDLMLHDSLHWAKYAQKAATRDTMLRGLACWDSTSSTDHERLEAIW